MSTPDRIERETQIEAPLERVWGIVSDPGWWIGGEDRSGQTRSRDGELHVVEDPRYGRFPIRVEATDAPRYIAYRWIPTDPGEAPPQAGTLVEFWLSEHDGGTLLRVVESGFAALPFPDETSRQSAVDDNTDGWEQELAIAKARAEGIPA